MLKPPARAAVKREAVEDEDRPHAGGGPEPEWAADVATVANVVPRIFETYTRQSSPLSPA